MRTDRWLLAALAFLIGGLWLTFVWGHGNVGVNVAFPAAGTKLAIDLTTTGWPVMTGVPLVMIGVPLMAIASSRPSSRSSIVPVSPSLTPLPG
jgi:hypothetical protein